MGRVVDSAFTALDIAKCAVEHFMNCARHHYGPSVKLDNAYMLLTTAPVASCLNCSYGEHIAIFEDSMKNLTVQDHETDPSPAISTAFSILNKYRTMNGTDSIGLGRCPWLTDPGIIILLTDGISSSLKDIVLSKPAGTGGEFTMEPFRWDQRFFSLVINGGLESVAMRNKTHPPPPDHDVSFSQLRTLAHLTGGDCHECNGLKDTLSTMKQLFIRIAVPSVLIKLAPQLAPQLEASTEPNAVTLPPEGLTCSLVVKEHGEWPIPEAFWVDKKSEHVQQRHAHPTLTISSTHHQSTMLSTTSLQAFLHTAADIDLSVDVYELHSHSSSSSSSSYHKPSVSHGVLKALGARKDIKLTVFVQGSGLEGGGGGGCVSHPVGVIQASGRGPDAEELILLPYNFPVLIPILKKVVDAHRIALAAAGGAHVAHPNININQSSQAVHVSPQIREELLAYVRTVPMSHLTALANLFRKFKIYNVLQTDDVRFSRPLYKQLRNAKQRAMSEIENLSPVSRSRASGTGPFISMGSSHHHHHGRKMLPDVPWKSVALNQTEPLLVTYNRLHKRVFGGTSVLLRGLHVSGLSGNGGRVDADGSSGLAWFAEALGGDIAPKLPVRASFCRSIRDMGNFARVLAEKEALRDPLLVHPPPDEDQPSGILRRRFAVNFGNPFQKNHFSTRSSRRFANTTAEGLLAGHESQTEIHDVIADEAAAEVQLLFMDTPQIHREESSDDMGAMSTTVDPLDDNKVHAAVVSAVDKSPPPCPSPSPSSPAPIPSSSSPFSTSVSGITLHLGCPRGNSSRKRRRSGSLGSGSGSTTTIAISTPPKTPRTDSNNDNTNTSTSGGNNRNEDSSGKVRTPVGGSVCGLPLPISVDDVGNVLERQETPTDNNMSSPQSEDRIMTGQAVSGPLDTPIMSPRKDLTISDMASISPTTPPRKPHTEPSSPSITVAASHQSVIVKVPVSTTVEPLSRPLFKETEAKPQSVEVVGDEEALPPGWVKQYSRQHQRPYWFNSTTGISVWTAPKLPP
eukprot:gene9658-20085_t